MQKLAIYVLYIYALKYNTKTLFHPRKFYQLHNHKHKWFISRSINRENCSVLPVN